MFFFVIVFVNEYTHKCSYKCINVNDISNHQRSIITLFQIWRYIDQIISKVYLVRAIISYKCTVFLQWYFVKKNALIFCLGIQLEFLHKIDTILLHTSHTSF